MAETVELLCTIEELGRLSGISTRTLRTWVSTGRLVPLRGDTSMIGRKKKRRCLLFTPAHLGLVLSWKTAAHWCGEAVPITTLETGA